MTTPAKADRHWSDDLEAMKEIASRDHIIESLSRRFALDALADRLMRPRTVFLDTGCSTGWLLDDARSRFPGAEVCGVDPFFSGLQKVKSRTRGIRLIQSDLCRAPFESGSFDAIASLNVLEHIEDDVQALREINRILKLDGRAFLMVPAGKNLYNYFDEIDHHVRRYEKNEFRDKILEAGLVLRRLSYMGILLYPAFYLVKKIGQWKMRGKSVEEKKQQVMKDIRPDKGSVIGKAALELEVRIGSLLPQRFGMRLVALVEKGPA